MWLVISMYLFLALLPFAINWYLAVRQQRSLIVVLFGTLFLNWLLTFYLIFSQKRKAVFFFSPVKIQERKLGQCEGLLGLTDSLKGSSDEFGELYNEIFNLPHLRSIAPNLKMRSALLRAIREYFYEEDFLEVQTPVRIAAPAPEEHIVPEPSGDCYLITSPELQMKQLLAADDTYEKIFQMGPVFRQGEVGHCHTPEFTLLEWYRGAGAPIEAMMDDCERLVTGVMGQLNLPVTIDYQGQSIDCSLPWRRMTVREAFEKYAGWNPEGNPDPERFYFDLVDKVEPNLPKDKPLFLTDYPATFASLARLNPKNPLVAERFELYMGGLELANAYGELTDAAEQRSRFEVERALIEKQGRSAPPIDEAFLNALSHMPKASGIALGVDRLLMVLTNSKHIAAVTAFGACVDD